MILNRIRNKIGRGLGRIDHALTGKPHFTHVGGHAWLLSGLPFGDSETNRFRSQLRLFEDATPLLTAHQLHAVIAKLGHGRYSHWKSQLFFSTSDNSDPNTNGRDYTYDFNLSRESWERARACRLWRFHPRADIFLARCSDVPPPQTCNISLTNKCNLRCEICGSQKYLDVSGVRRRHMKLDTFEAVAQTLFPVLVTVELNSQGDPLLHPDIGTVLARIREHRCEVKVQTNGTLFSDAVIAGLCEQHGTVMLSLDAVGPKFEEVRSGGNWQQAEAGLKRFLAARDPRRLSTGIYPTLTKRTIGEALNVVRWAVEHDIDEVAFHRYVPIQNSWEESPDESEHAALKDRLARWCSDNKDPIVVKFEAEQLNCGPTIDRKSEVADPEKSWALTEFYAPIFPTDGRDQIGDATYICTAPISYVDIGLEGQIAVCCRSQDVPLGYATSVEKFAEAWFGPNYQRIRESMRRDATGDFPIPNCEGCIKAHAPTAAGARVAVNYDDPRPAMAISFAASEIRVEALQKERGHCFISRIPPGVDAGGFILYEDDRTLGPSSSLHEDIRQLGAGRYSVHNRWLYFSTSDGSDARRNGRVYQLCRQSIQDDATPKSPTGISNVVHTP